VLLVFLGPALALYSVFVVYPLFSALQYSLFDWAGTVRGPFVGLDNFTGLFTTFPLDEQLTRAFGHNVVFFLGTMLIQNSLGLAFAVLLHNRRLTRRVFQTLYTLPYLVSPLVVGYLWVLMLRPQFGLLNALFDRVGPESLSQPWLGNPDTALPVVILINAWQWVGFPMLLFGAALAGIPEEYDAAARVDGAGPWRTFRHITLPLLTPAIGTVTVLTFIGSFNLFALAYAGRAGPRLLPHRLRGRRQRDRQLVGAGGADVRVHLRHRPGRQPVPAPQGGRALMTALSPSLAPSLRRGAVLLLLGAYAVVAVGPLVFMLLNSFRPSADIFDDPLGLPTGLYLGNYVEAWREARFATYFTNSVLIVVAGVVLCTVVSAMAAYPLARYDFRLNGVTSAYFIAGLTLPIELAVVPIFYLLGSFGLVDSRTGLVLVYAATGIPFSVFILSAFFRGLPRDLEEAARLDGAGEFRIFARVMLPLVKPAIATVAIFQFVQLWNDFFFPLVLLRSSEKYTLPVGLTNFFGEYQTDWGAVFAGLVITTAPLVILFLFLTRQIVSGLVAGMGK
jgi:raffinose/stachyose/melibiose transport system permease protein